MANEAALTFLREKITAMQIVVQEMTRIYLGTTDLNLADAIRAEITSMNQVLFALESARNSLEASANEVPPPSAERVQALIEALHRLDTYVRSDQQIHLALNFLTEVANLIDSA